MTIAVCRMRRWLSDGVAAKGAREPTGNLPPDVSSVIERSDYDYSRGWRKVETRSQHTEGGYEERWRFRGPALSMRRLGLALWRVGVNKGARREIC